MKRCILIFPALLLAFQIGHTQPKLCAGAQAGAGAGWMGYSEGAFSYPGISAGWAVAGGGFFHAEWSRILVRSGLEYEIKGWDADGFEGNDRRTRELVTLEPGRLRYNYLTLPLVLGGKPARKSPFWAQAGGYVSLPVMGGAYPHLYHLPLGRLSYAVILPGWRQQNLDAGLQAGLSWRIAYSRGGILEIQAQYRHGLLERGTVFSRDLDFHRTATLSVGYFVGIRKKTAASF